MVGPTSPGTGAYINRKYFRFERKYAYPQTRDKGECQRRRRNLRRALRKAMSLDQLGPVPTPRVHVQGTVRGANYIRQKVACETLPGNWVSAYLLIPDGRGRRPAVVCPHGHVPGAKQNVVGETGPDGTGPDGPSYFRPHGGCQSVGPAF